MVLGSEFGGKHGGMLSVTFVEAGHGIEWQEGR